MKRARGVVITMAVIVMGGIADAAQLFTESVLVDADDASKHWKTVYTNTVFLSWNWEATNAVRAALLIEGMNTSFTTNFTTAASNWLWRVSEADGVAIEDVYKLSLSFYDSNSAIVESMTSQLAVVAGTFGKALVNPIADSRAWTRVKDNVVIPYSAMWQADGTNAVSSQIVIAKDGGAVETNVFTDVSGYMGWKLRNNGWGYGVFNLSLSFAGTTNEWAAALTRSLDGTAVRIR